MQNLVFPIFITRLFFHNLFFVAKIFYLKNFHTIVTTFLLIFVLSQVLLLNKTLNPADKKMVINDIKKPIYQDILYLSNVSTIDTEDTKKSLEQQLLEHENLLKFQPTHRDLLINVAILNYELGNEDKFEEYLARAKQVDPNNEVFSN